ncbi:hypothetical protein PGIGA_G00224000, partial [Pangasianodon gigas]|nr:hypothetical protein [Pangasianodon gigas]
HIPSANLQSLSEHRLRERRGWGEGRARAGFPPHRARSFRLRYRARGTICVLSFALPRLSRFSAAHMEIIWS